MKLLRAALYARVSTAEQQTLALQTAAMQEYAERRGWTVVASVQDINGGTKHRPKREELIRMAKRRQLDMIVVWRLNAGAVPYRMFFKALKSCMHAKLTSSR